MISAVFKRIMASESQEGTQKPSWRNCKSFQKRFVEVNGLTIPDAGVRMPEWLCAVLDTDRGDLNKLRPHKFEWPNFCSTDSWNDVETVIPLELATFLSCGQTDHGLDKKQMAQMVLSHPWTRYLVQKPAKILDKLWLETPKSIQEDRVRFDRLKVRVKKIQTF